MRRLIVVAAIALMLPAAAAAKWEGELRLCGSSGCRFLDRHTGHDAWPLLDQLWGGSEVGPASPGPFYRVELLPPRSRSAARTFYFVPGARVVRDGEGWWRAFDPVAPLVEDAMRSIRPFGTPQIVHVDVNGKAAKNPQSYLMLFRLRAPAQPISDPAGGRPRPGDPRVARYYERVRRHWLPVTIVTRPASPWGDGRTEVWIGRRLDLVMRDGEVVRVSHPLAERIRRGDSLR